MTLEEAIKIHDQICYGDTLIIKYDIERALRLGREALKRAKDCRERTDIYPNQKLPGETKE